MAEILIIDDDPQMRRLLRRLLSETGHIVQEAANGEDGVSLFRQQHPVLVITDIVMPVREGIETIGELRRIDPKLPILAISGGGPEIYLRSAALLGATAVLEKPFDPGAFLALVGELLGRCTT
jgi:CheY-like chemotaxis protein